MNDHPFFEKTLICVLHTGELYGSARSCMAHLASMRPYFRDLHLLLMAPGPVQELCAEQHIPHTVIPILHKGLRHRPLTRSWLKDALHVLRSRRRAIVDAKSLFKRFDCVVHAHSSAATYAMIAAKYARVPLVTHVRETKRSRWTDTVRECIALWSSSRIVTVSEGIRLGYGRRFRKRAETIYNFCATPELGDTKQQHAKPCIGFVGSVHFEKGLREFLEVCQRLKADSVDYEAVVAGDTLDDTVAAWCDSFVRENRLTEYVRFEGHVNDLDSVYRRIDVLFHPSHFDALPRSIMEAMSFGIPVVATDVGGIPELVQHEETGFLVPRGDIEAMTSSVRRLLADAPLRATLGERAQQYVGQNFSEHVYVSRMLTIYRDLCESTS